MCYAKELKEGFVEYTEQVVKLMVPLLKFYFHDDILLMGGLATCWTSCALLKTVVGWAVCVRSLNGTVVVYCGWSLTVLSVRVRVAAAESMPLLLECARVRGPDYLTQMWHFMCDALIKAIGTEPDSDVLSEIMHSFAKVTNPHPTCALIILSVECSIFTHLMNFSCI